MIRRSLSIWLPLLAVSCQVKPYAPPPQLVVVESVEVEVREFEGRPEACAKVKGRLSTTAAQLIDARQSRIERTLVLEVLEQTPRGADLLPDLAPSPPFETRIPIELLGLDPGPCILHANGIEVSFEIPHLQAKLASQDSPVTPASRITLVDEFIPIEDTIPLGSGLVAPPPSSPNTPMTVTPLTTDPVTPSAGGVPY